MFRSSHFALAVHVLTALSIRDKELIPSAELARSINTNPAFLRSLLGKLREAGLVRIQMGAGGGAELAYPATKMSLKEVRDAVESRGCMQVHRSEPNCQCLVGRNILSVLSKIEEDVENVIDKKLAKTTVADIAKEVSTLG